MQRDSEFVASLKIFWKKVVQKFGREKKKGVPLQHFRRWKGADKGPGRRRDKVHWQDWKEASVVQEKERSQFRPGITLKV